MNIQTERKVRDMIDSYLATEKEITHLVDTYSMAEIENDLDLKEAAQKHAVNTIMGLAKINYDSAIEMINEVAERRGKRRA